MTLAVAVAIHPGRRPSCMNFCMFQVPSRKKFSNRRAVFYCRSADISLSLLHVGATYAGGLSLLYRGVHPPRRARRWARGCVELVVDSSEHG
jgi:hypothetical protein